MSYHPDRIYFAESIEDVKGLLPRFIKINPNINEYSIYEIDIKSASRDNSQIRYFNDPNFDNGIYTLSNIPPRFVKFVERVTM
jgi:hypothetical protein